MSECPPTPHSSVVHLNTAPNLPGCSQIFVCPTKSSIPGSVPDVVHAPNCCLLPVCLCSSCKPFSILFSARTAKAGVEQRRPHCGDWQHTGRSNAAFRPSGSDLALSFSRTQSCCPRSGIQWRHADYATSVGKLWFAGRMAFQGQSERHHCLLRLQRIVRRRSWTAAVPQGSGSVH